VSIDEGKIKSPETYFGSGRNEDPSVYIGGKWSVQPEYAETTDASIITYNYSAKNVYMVASDPDGNQIEVYVDGVKINTVDIKDEKLYTLVAGADYGTHKLELHILKKGLKAFTFTFG